MTEKKKLGRRTGFRGKESEFLSESGTFEMYKPAGQANNWSSGEGVRWEMSL